jgi:hypothetical protein
VTVDQPPAARAEVVAAAAAEQMAGHAAAARLLALEAQVLVAEAPAGPEEQGLHRAGADREPDGDVPVGELLDLAHEQAGPLLAGEAGGHPGEHLARLGHLEGCLGLPGAPLVGPPLHGGGGAVDELHPPARAQPREADVGGHAVQPGHDVEAVVHPVGDAEQAEEGLLDAVVGLGGIAQVAQGEGADALTVAREQLLEAAHVTAAVGDEERNVAGGGLEGGHHRGSAGRLSRATRVPPADESSRAAHITLLLDVE